MKLWLRHTTCKFRMAFSFRSICLHNIYFIIVNDSNLSTIITITIASLIYCDIPFHIVYSSRPPIKFTF